MLNDAAGREGSQTIATSELFSEEKAERMT